jgi:sec-independent protein translocase protein TatB
MFDIGWSELLVIAVVAIVVVGPKDLPPLMRSFGRYAGKLRRMAGDFQRQFEDTMRESEIEEVRKAIEGTRHSIPSLDLRAPIDRPMMLPKEAPDASRATAAATIPKPAALPKPKTKSRPKRAVAKAKGATQKRRKAAAERKP